MQPSSSLLAKILAPYDGSTSARVALKYTAALAMAGCGAIQGLTLLQVTGGGYLARHIQNVDLRVTRLAQSKEWQHIRQHYLDTEIKPLLAQGQEMLRQYGFRAPIDTNIAEGKIGEKILAEAREGKYSAIIMGRRGLSPVKELVLGSVSHYVLTRATGLTVFVVGPESTGFQDSPLFPLLLPVDGSAASLEAVRQAVSLARGCTVQTPRIILLHVVDLALLGQTLAGETSFLVEEGQKALAAARQILDQAGLGGYTQEKLVNGIPAQVIAEEAETQRCALVFMGSVGLSALARLFIGSITNSVLHQVTKPTIAVAYPQDNTSH